MHNYLFIESQGSFDCASVPQFFALARDLAKQGNTVEIFLVQNGVMPARAGAKADALATVVEAGIAVWADEFSLKERALPRDQMMRGVASAGIATVVDRMADGWKVVWH